MRPGFRSLFLATTALLGFVLLGGGSSAQLESGDRGIMPLDSSNTLEVDGITVDTGGKSGEEARLAGWREAQRLGFRALYAKAHGVPLSEAPTLPDSDLDGIVSSIMVQREQIGPNRYIATLGVLFDRARAAQLLGVPGGPAVRSQPMLLIPIMTTGGVMTTVELRNSWQRAWATFRTAQSPIDYVRISGFGSDPLLINAAQTARPGRGWWRNLLDLYGATDLLVAQVDLHRAYPGGPAVATFLGRHGPDGQVVGSFRIEMRDGQQLQSLMDEGVRRMDGLFAQAFAAGRLDRDSSLNQPPPPPPPPTEAPEAKTQQQAAPSEAPIRTVLIQANIADASQLGELESALRSIAVPGGVGASSTQPGKIALINIRYQGDLAVVKAGLNARGWNSVENGSALHVWRMPVANARPGPQPAPPAPSPAGE
ncbi:heavy-metal-associated domain-containing protein [Sphingomonas ginkgonis]|uniref:Heavy-metal-associated domain-containing protein n=1 Tax=Sphingomonas ginkgonis TaxID=2315330 RepID=A0A429VB91_9SPHN|nr:heavy-metal-associated domain-containing protein [Sphingomonas ginkgonis]RST31204.1 heavy-metal-associated domain-containing protein [Sphingomonas ginkgonis]